MSPTEIARQQQLLTQAQMRQQPKSSPASTSSDPSKSATAHNDDIFSLVDTEPPAAAVTNGSAPMVVAAKPKSAFSLLDNDPFASPTKPIAMQQSQQFAAQFQQPRPSPPKGVRGCANTSPIVLQLFIRLTKLQPAMASLTLPILIRP